MTKRHNEILARAEKIIKDNEKEKGLFFIESKNGVYIAYCYEGRKVAQDSDLTKIMQKCRELNNNADCQFLIDDMTVKKCPEMPLRLQK